MAFQWSRMNFQERALMLMSKLIYQNFRMMELCWIKSSLYNMFRIRLRHSEEGDSGVYVCTVHDSTGVFRLSRYTTLNVIPRNRSASLQFDSIEMRNPGNISSFADEGKGLKSNDGNGDYHFVIGVVILSLCIIATALIILFISRAKGDRYGLHVVLL